MARTGLQFWHLLIVVLLAAMAGTALGDLLGKAFPETTFGRIMSAGITVGSSAPYELELRVATLTIGVVLRLTLLGALGSLAALIVFFRRL